MPDDERCGARRHGSYIEQGIGGQLREPECGCIVEDQRSQQGRHVGIASTDGVHDLDAWSRDLQAVPSVAITEPSAPRVSATSSGPSASSDEMMSPDVDPGIQP